MGPLPATDIRSDRFNDLPLSRSFSKQPGAEPLPKETRGEENGQDSSPTQTDSVVLSLVSPSSDPEPVENRETRGVQLTTDGQYRLSMEAQTQVPSRTSPENQSGGQPEALRDLAGSQTENLHTQGSASVEEQADSISQTEVIQGEQLNLTRSIENSGSSSTQPTSTRQLESDAAQSPRVQEYINMIKQISDDPEAVDEFVEKLNEFTGAETAESAGSGEMQAVDQSVISSEAASTSITVRNEEMQQRIVEKYTQDETPPVVTNNVVFRWAQQEVRVVDPLVLDLDNNGIDLTNVTNGVSFDITGTGEVHQTAFVSGNDAFLALDLNQNGSIDDGHELFGDQNGAADGLEELRKYDENNDGVIDSSDSVFNKLQLFNDRNRDGITQEGELRSLADENISSLDLSGREENRTVAGGNFLTKSSGFTRQDGSRGYMGDVLLNYLA